MIGAACPQSRQSAARDRAHECFVGFVSQELRSAALSSWSAIVTGTVNLGMPMMRAPAWDDGTSSVLMLGLSSDNVGHVVARDMAVAADEFETLMPCLGDQQAVERVAVMRWQRFDGQGVRDGDG